MPVIINGIQKSPCACSKARHALKLTRYRSHSESKISKKYWAEIVEYIATEHKVDEQLKKSAIALYGQYIPKLNLSRD